MAGKFGAKSTTEEVLAGVDLKGKRILVTGVSAGLGVETARALVAHGADVVGAARDLDKAKRATAEVSKAAAESGGSFELVATRPRQPEERARRGGQAGRRWPLVRCDHRQCRCHGDSVGEDRGWFRDAIRDQSPRPLRLCEPHREAASRRADAWSTFLPQGTVSAMST